MQNQNAGLKINVQVSMQWPKRKAQSPRLHFTTAPRRVERNPRLRFITALRRVERSPRLHFTALVKSRVRSPHLHFAALIKTQSSKPTIVPRRKDRRSCHDIIVISGRIVQSPRLAELEARISKVRS